MKNLIDSFLEDEISDQEYYDGIYEFIVSFNIRCGEYEGNRFIIKKMDHINFFIFDEYVYPEDGHREIHKTISIYKDNLIKLINEYAKKQGLKLRDSY
ncbi:hypothetical protein [Neobacillus sp. DY30]|uniref:hypothetical protein n=1 Tax=Neobacillus sp. DY30 TaxID=3047871 RepID=UPI0024BFBA12|nr:hypothetical protein [Neobacillus sp. DY30]WHY01335.1 hypothetical protein QNH29_03530 [Neobacillus sp. DY30]